MSGIDGTLAGHESLRAGRKGFAGTQPVTKALP
jgi:hypothetical protein